MALLKIRSLQTAAFLAIVMTVLSGVAAQFYFKKKSIALGWVEHSMLVQNAAQIFLSTLVDAETGQRGYLLTGKDSYLDPYRTASVSLTSKLQKLKNLTADNQQQQSRLFEIDKLLPEKMQELAATIEAFSGGNRAAAEAEVNTDSGKAIMNKIRGQLNAFQTEEQNLLAARSSEADMISKQLLALMSLSLLTASGVAAFMFRLLRRNLDDMTKSRDEVTKTNAALEEKVEQRLSELEQSKVTIAREARRSSIAETRQQLAIGAADLGTWDLDLATGLSERTLRHDQIFGYDDALDKWTLDDFISRIHPDVRENTAALLAEATKNLAPWNFECKIIRERDHTTRWIEVHGQPRFDDAGILAGYLGVVSDITDRKQRAEYMEFVTRELAHRSKNMLAVIQAISRQTAKNENSLSSFEKSFNARLTALSQSQDMLLSQNWRGSDMKDLILSQIAMFGHEERLDVEGRALSLKPEAAQNFGLAIHELATNAVKYGAFSVPGGEVKVSWSVNGERVKFRWLERGGPPVTPPDRIGFGNFVTGKMIAQTLSGIVKTDYFSSGLSWNIEFPIDCLAT